VGILVLSACGNKDEEDKERLDELNNQVNELYNEDKDDVSDDLDSESMEEVYDAIKIE